MSDSGRKCESDSGTSYLDSKPFDSQFEGVFRPGGALSIKAPPVLDMASGTWTTMIAVTQAGRNSSSPREVMRTTECGDSLKILPDEFPPTWHIITSLPDYGELKDTAGRDLSLADYKSWFLSTTKLLLSRATDHSLVIFYQSDRKLSRDAKHGQSFGDDDGTWLDKSHLLQLGADAAGSRLLWHKIALLAPAGTVKFGRPGYTHMLCFSRRQRDLRGLGMPDVFDRGFMTWPAAMGSTGAALACSYISKIIEHTNAFTSREESAGFKIKPVVVDPFCGEGTVLSVANAHGFDSYGIEISRKRCKQAAHQLLS